MSVSSIYTSFLIEEIIKESLRQGTVLTKGGISQRLQEISVNNPFLSEPFTQRSLYLTSAGEALSSGKMNEVLLSLTNDLSVAYKAMTDQASSVTSTYDSVSSEFKSIEKRIKLLEEKTRNLLVVSKNAEGYLDYISDTFINKDKVDLDKTTAFADNKVGVVTLEPKTHNRISMPVIDSDLQFNVTTRDQLRAITLAPGSEIVNAFTDQENAWIQRVQMNRGVGAVSATLIVRMPNASAEVSKIIYKPAVSDEGNISTVTVQYSDDGINWYNVDGSGTARLIGDVTLIFKPVKTAYWKFIFNKAGYDEFRGDAYVYEFGAKSIQMYGVEYKTSNNKLTGTLITKALVSDQGTSFDRVSLKVCESLPAGTTISYSIAGLTEQEISDYNSGALSIDDINFGLITPLDREESIHSKVINFANISGLSGLLSSVEKDSLIDFRYRTDNNVLLDYVVPGSAVREAIQVWRNTGDNQANGGSNLPVMVKRIDNGWSFDGTYYSCEFFINEDSGKIIDFGRKDLQIDNTMTSGQVTLAKGRHKIKTHKDNWRGIEPAAMTTTDNPDILYPYNHKYLIEGIGEILYGSDMTDLISTIPKKDIVDPNGVYSGALRYWEKSLEEVTIFNFTQNIDMDNYNVFAFVKDLGGNERILIKDSIEPGLLVNEKLAIITKNLSGDLHKGIILKAELNSEDSKITPVLDEYIIRLGI